MAGTALYSALVWLVLTLVYRLLVLLMTVEWLSFVLRSFPFTRAWGESLNSFLLSLAMPVITAAMGAVPELLTALLTALLIFYLAYLITQALERFFSNFQSGTVQLHWLDADVVAPTQRIAKVVVWLFALAMAYPYLPGSDTEAFKGLSVLVGLMLSMGASSLVGQAASGPTEPRPRALLLSALHANIQDVFNEYGVQIMSPQYFEDPKEPKVVPPSDWYPAPAVRPDGIPPR